MLHRENCESGGSRDRMAGRVPLEVGTRGTIGSLLKREIDYFRNIEVENRMSSERRSSEGGRFSWPSFRMVAPWRRKKRRSSGIRPGICSMVEVADSERLNEIRGFGYLNLRVDSERYDGLN